MPRQPEIDDRPIAWQVIGDDLSAVDRTQERARSAASQLLEPRPVRRKRRSPHLRVRAALYQDSVD